MHLQALILRSEKAGLLNSFQLSGFAASYTIGFGACRDRLQADPFEYRPKPAAGACAKAFADGDIRPIEAPSDSARLGAF